MAPDGYFRIIFSCNLAFSKPKRFSIKLIDQFPESEYFVSVIKL
jgi:hypothetical protein